MRFQSIVVAARPSTRKGRAVLWRLGPILALLICLSPPAGAHAADAAGASLEEGYRLMYGLNFDAAALEFQRWQAQHPGEPLGAVSQAANLLFAEFERLGVLEAQFFVDNSAFQSRQKLLPDANVKRRFERVLEEGEGQARSLLATKPGSPDALFALALASGLRADYAALIESRNFASLRFTRRAGQFAKQLLAIQPAYFDAYLATGIAKYIVGSMPAPLRWLYQIAGYESDRQAGIDELRLTAAKGKYLGPFARILLAIAALRERDTAQARRLLTALHEEFPSNPLFSRELSRLAGGEESRP